MYNSNFYFNRVNPIIVDYVRGDVNGDKVPDNIYLTGIKTPDSPFVQNITIVIQDGRTGLITSISLKENTGYEPKLHLADITGDGTDDILIGIATGGSGGTMYYYIYSYINNIARLLFDFNAFNEQYQYDVTYKDNYKVEVISKANNAKYILDITYKGEEYLNEIYDKNGKLKAPITGFVNPISGLFPVDFDANKVYELLIYQRIAGRYNADGLGYMQNVIQWENNQFVLRDQYLAIFGTEA